MSADERRSVVREAIRWYRSIWSDQSDPRQLPGSQVKPRIDSGVLAGCQTEAAIFAAVKKAFQRAELSALQTIALPW